MISNSVKKKVQQNYINYLLMERDYAYAKNLKSWGIVSSCLGVAVFIGIAINSGAWSSVGVGGASAYAIVGIILLMAASDKKSRCTNVREALTFEMELLDITLTHIGPSSVNY